MGLSRLLQPQLTSHFHTIGFSTQIWRHFSQSSGNKGAAARARKTQAVETYVRKHIEKHPGSFPKATHVHKEIGGSWYTLKELLQSAKEKIFGNSDVLKRSSNDDKSNSTAGGTASTAMVSHSNSSEKSDHGESGSSANALRIKGDTSPSQASCTSGKMSSHAMDISTLEAKRTCYNQDKSGISKPGNLTTSSAQMKSNGKDESAGQAISNVKEEQCSETVRKATPSELTRVYDSPYCDRLTEAASHKKSQSYRPDLFQKKKGHRQLEVLQNAIEKAMGRESKSEQLPSLLSETTIVGQGETEDKVASTGSLNLLENKMFLDRCEKKKGEPPAAVADENGHLQSEEMPSRVCVNSKTEITTAILQKGVPSTHSLSGMRVNQPQNQGSIATDKVPKEGGMPSGDSSKQFAGLSALFNKLDNQEAGHMMNKSNNLAACGYLEDSEEINRGNMAKFSDINDLISCIKGYPKGHQVASDLETVISSNDNIKVQTHTNMHNTKNDEEQKASSSHSLDKKSEKDPSSEGPMSIVFKNGKADNQEKGDADSGAFDANKLKPNTCVKPMKVRHQNKAQDTTPRESLDQNTVLLKFVRKDAEEGELKKALRFRGCGDVLKIKFSNAGQSLFKTATVYFKTKEAMQNALQTTDILMRGICMTVETASSLESQSKKINIPSLIGDPDAPAALVKNPTRTVAIKQLTHKICSRHIEEALVFCKSNISGFFMGSSNSVAYVEFETEDGKERALAKQSIVVLGKRLFIFRVDTPRTTIVRISATKPELLLQNTKVIKSYGKCRQISTRSSTMVDVHFCISEWPNMLNILNKLNGMQVEGNKLMAEPATQIPPDILCELYRQPEERKYLKDHMLRLLQKLEEPVVSKTKADNLSKFYGEQWI